MRVPRRRWRATALALLAIAALYSALPGPTVLGAGPYTPGSTGYDISWPQCGGRYPDPPYAFGIIGVTGGRAFTRNSCLDAAVVIAPPAATVTAVAFAASTLASAQPATWTITFTTGTSAALGAGNEIDISFPPAFVLPDSPAVTLGGGFASCSATASTAGGTASVVLADNGGTCTLVPGATATVALAGVTNPPPGLYPSSLFAVSTTTSPAAAHPAGPITIVLARSRLSLSVGFQPVSWDGPSLQGGAAVRGYLDQSGLLGAWSGLYYPAPGTDPIRYGWLFPGGASGTLPQVVTGQVYLLYVSKPAALTWGPASAAVLAQDLGAAATASNVWFSAPTQVAGATEDWSAGFTTSPAGALGAGASVTVAFPSGFAVPAAPKVVLGGGFSACSASAAVIASTITVTLASSGGTCALPGSTAASLAISGITNPPPGRYPGTGFSVATSSDRLAVSPRSEYLWAQQATAPPTVYMNLNFPAGSTAWRGLAGPRGVCNPADLTCQAYNYGYNAGQDAYLAARGAGVSAAMWWLDIETANTWSGDTTLNATVIQGAIDYLRAQGATVGIYSTSYQWRKIAGSFSPALPNWVATGAGTAGDAATYCSPDRAFGGGTVWLAQFYPSSGFDANYICPSS